MSRSRWLIIITAGLLVLLFGRTIVTLYTDWLWFGELGYRRVFWVPIVGQLKLGLAAGLFFFAVVYSNLWLARRLAPPIAEQSRRGHARSRIGVIAKRGFGLVVLGLAFACAVLVGFAISVNWLSYAMFSNPISFNSTDPIFGKDIGFYIFRLGFLRYLYGMLFFTVVVAGLATAVVHYIERTIEILAGIPTFAPHVKAHLSVLLAAVLFVKAWGYRLAAYDLLYSPTGVVYGAGYTDIHARLLALRILPIVAVIAGVVALINIYKRGIVLPVAAIAILLVASIALGNIYPWFVQQMYVRPNEIRLESEYIAHNIHMTRKAFNLDLIREENFPALTNLSAEDIRKNHATVKSIRLWDYRPIRSTYSQLQALWQYYEINNVDIDRYVINGELRQVMLAARELSPEAAQAGAGTWVNQHFQYTHGYGAVMSPVNKATPEGLPEFFVEDIPPVSSVGISITVPQIYFGEQTTTYVVVNSKEREFDYPAEGQPVYTRYAGKGGVPIGGFLNRLAFSWRFSDVNLILKNPITRNSRLMFRRQIGERVSSLCPYLRYDHDPYLVIHDGRLFWIWDAYTVSNAFPYSTPYQFDDRGSRINYIRNAVKVVIDAYNGSVDYYIADEGDPIIQAYSRIFPGLFKPINRMPQGLRAHIRYPERFFVIQSHVLLTYHMRDPQVFYNKGDRWDIPNEVVGVSKEELPIEPYYVVMKLPGEAKEEFIMMRPFTPQNKQNMIAWIAARCGPENYGEVILYQFPKDKLIYGPAQIESRINQDPVISPQLTLWDQAGSRVNRGNQLVIPIEQSIIYVKPLYLESATTRIPELKRVIVAYGGQLAMESTLSAALNKVFGASVSDRGIETTTAQPGDTRRLIDEAVELFERAQELQRKGDWAGYGETLRKLGETLRKLRAVTPAKT